MTNKSRLQNESVLDRVTPEDQLRQMLRVYSAEIDELKESLRYVEIQMAKSKD